MPTKRSRVSRHTRPRVSDAAIDYFRRAWPLQAGRIACIKSRQMCTHAACGEHRELARALDRELHLRPWERSPLDVDDGPMPDNCRHPDDYRQAQELRAELIRLSGDMK